MLTLAVVVKVGHFPEMNFRLSLCIAVAAVSSSPLFAAEYMGPITSEVYQTEGSTEQIARKANICISQRLAPGVANAPLIISSDLPNGVIVARSAIEYSDKMIAWKVRSTFTFEARENRFRIVQSNLERFNDQFNVGWHPIGKWSGSGWKKAEAAFVESADTIARCVVTPGSKDDW